MSVTTNGLKQSSLLARERDRELLALLSSLGSPDGWTLLATGGYGRLELSPQSDLDLLLLLPESGGVPPWVETLVQRLWAKGWRVGHSVRSAKETSDMIHQDVRTFASLLDGRYLAGNPNGFWDIEKQIKAALQSKTVEGFLREKWEERTRRLKRVGTTVRMQEPDLKDGRGGLRDYLWLRWFAQAYQFEYRQNPWRVFPYVLGSAASRELRRSVSWMMSLRNFLHAENNRPGDRLSFLDQERLAKGLRIRGGGGLRGPERMMTTFFGHAERIAMLAEETYFGKIDREVRANEKRQRRLPLPELLGQIRDQVERSIPVPTLAAQILPRVAGLTRKEMRQALDFLWGACSDPKCIGPLLRACDRSTLLSELFAPWRRIRHRIQHNFLHAYTIDEHLLRTVDEAARLLLTADERHRSLATDPATCRILLIAAWLHDIGKGSAGDHSALGTNLARTILKAMGAPSKDRTEILFLVRNHLLLSHVAQRRDTDDPKVISNFVRKVKTAGRARLLEALTIADMKATGPSVFTTWKHQLLKKVTDAAVEALDVGAKRRPGINALRAELIRTLQVGKGSPESARTWTAFLRKFPSPYVYGVTEETVRADDALLAKAKKSEGHATSYQSNEALRTARLTIALPDRLGLFALLTRILAREGWNIRAAEIFTTSGGYVVDRFHVDQPSNFAHRKARLEKTLKNSLASNTPPSERRSHSRAGMPERPLPEIPRDVVINNRAADRYTVVEVYGKDRLGLLADLADVFTQRQIHVHQALIVTEGARVADVFYVGKRSGRKITAKKEIGALKCELEKSIQE